MSRDPPSTVEYSLEQVAHALERIASSLEAIVLDKMASSQETIARLGAKRFVALHDFHLIGVGVRTCGVCGLDQQDFVHRGVK